MELGFYFQSFCSRSNILLLKIQTFLASVSQKITYIIIRDIAAYGLTQNKQKKRQQLTQLKTGRNAIFSYLLENRQMIKKHSHTNVQRNLSERCKSKPQ